MGLNRRLVLIIGLCLVAFLLGLVGCAPQTVEQPTAAPTEVALVATPTAAPTDTPQPTPTAEPTSTPVPTATPMPTATPVPTATPLPPTPTPVKVNIQPTKLDGGWTLYDNMDEGFGLALPPTWMQLGLDQESLGVLMGTSEDDPETQAFVGWMSSMLNSTVKLFGVELAADASKTGYPPNVSVIKTRLPGNLTLDGVVAASVRALETQQGVSKPVSHKRVKLANSDAEQFQYRIVYDTSTKRVPTPTISKQTLGLRLGTMDRATAADAPLTVSVTQYLILDGKDEYVVTLAATADQEKKYAPTFAKIGQSFRLGWPPRLVLSDDFANPDEGLFEADKGTDEYKVSSSVTLSCQWEYKYSDKALVAQVRGSYPKGAEGYMCGHAADAFDEMPDRFAVEVRAKATKSSAAARYGIRLYSDLDSDVFEFVVSPSSGTYRLSHYMGQWESLAHGSSSAIKRGTGENLLRLEVRGDNLVALVNGQEVTRVQHPSLPMQSTYVLLDFYMGEKAADGYVEVRFSQFKAYWLGPK